MLRNTRTSKQQVQIDLILSSTPKLSWAQTHTTAGTVTLTARLGSFRAARPDRVVAEVHSDGTYFLVTRHYPGDPKDITLTALKALSEKLEI